MLRVSEGLSFAHSEFPAQRVLDSQPDLVGIQFRLGGFPAMFGVAHGKREFFSAPDCTTYLACTWGSGIRRLTNATAGRTNSMN